MIESIPLNRLMLSALNVRQTERDADIAALAEDIAARGLKQNLVVIPAHFVTGGSEKDWKKGAPKNRFEVIAGGRRFQAMQLLAADGRLPADHPVPCMVEDREAARETSLSENLHRVAMNPADEFLAFAAIVEQHQQAGDADPAALCAKRFGVSRRLVEERLRLAALAPELLDALRSGTIGVDSAKAYAITADHDAQRKVFEGQCKAKFRPHDPRQVRDELRGRTLPLDHEWLTFVGLDAYRAAGGRTETEMFMGAEGAERALDAALAERLAQQRGDELAADVAPHADWLRGIFSLKPWAERPPEGYKRTWCSDPEYTPADERARAIALYTIDPEDSTAIAFVEAYAPVEPAPADEEDDDAATPRWQPETPEQRAARERAHKVEVWAARLAVGSFAGTPLEGKAFWPNSYWNSVEWQYPEDAEPDDEEQQPTSAQVMIWVEVPADRIAAHRAAAEAKVDQIEAERAAALERARAAQAEAGAEAEDEDEEETA